MFVLNMCIFFFFYSVHFDNASTVTTSAVFCLPNYHYQLIKMLIQCVETLTHCIWTFCVSGVDRPPALGPWSYTPWIRVSATHCSIRPPLPSGVVAKIPPARVTQPLPPLHQERPALPPLHNRTIALSFYLWITHIWLHIYDNALAFEFRRLDFSLRLPKRNVRPSVWFCKGSDLLWAN